MLTNEPILHFEYIQVPVADCTDMFKAIVVS